MCSLALAIILAAEKKGMRQLIAAILCLLRRCYNVEARLWSGRIARRDNQEGIMRPIDWAWHISSDYARLIRRLFNLAKPAISATPFLLLVSALIAAFSGFSAATPPDLVLYNGRVFTSDATLPKAQAIAIGGRFVIAVGTSEEVRALAGPNTELIDLQGRVAVPGFNDAHFHHLPNPPGFQLQLNFPEPTWREVLAALASAVKEAPKDSWIYGKIGATVVNDAQPSRGPLDRLAPDHPVLLYSWFGHGHVINSRAMQRLGIAEEEPNPVGGRWEREPGSQRINGKFFEYAGWPLFRKLEDSASNEQLIQSLQQLGDEAARFGVTSIQNMTHLPLDRYSRLLAESKFPVRMRLIRWPATDRFGRDLKDGLDLPLHPHGAPLVIVSGTKWVLDGTPLERGMALRSEYRDRRGWSGALNFPETEIAAMLRDTVKRNDQSLFHAPGDKTIEAVLNAMIAVDPVEPHWPPRRVRLEHGDGLLPDLVPLAKKLGVIVVQNPTHFDPKMNPIIARFGPRSPYLSLRSIVATGIPLAIGSVVL
jgi:predicted amidohydrolase YtcJ